MPSFREEVINVRLADLLAGYGLEANPETLSKEGRPDVLINMGGIKVVLEGRVGDQPSLERDARRRVEGGIADISLALFYPGTLRKADSAAHLNEKLKAARFAGVLYYLQADGIRIEKITDVGIPDLVETLNSVFRIYVRNDILRAHVERVQTAIERAVTRSTETGLFFQSKTVLDHLKKVLGIVSDN